MRSLYVLALSLALATPLAYADAPAAVTAEPIMGAPATSGGADAVNYVHDDCVGPGLPGTAAPHATHTTLISGFAIDPARPISIGVVTLALFGAGICPTALSGPVLPQDFTGRWSLTGICRGTQNDGAVFVTWTADFLSGFPMGSTFGGGSCVGQLGAPFALQVTVSISSTSLLGVPVGAVGGIQHSLAQG